MWDKTTKLPVAVQVIKVLAPTIDESFKGYINYLELLAACIPILVWAPSIEGCRIVVRSDNTQTVAFLNRGTTKNLAALKWLKYVFNCCLRYNIRVTLVYSAGQLTC